MIFQDIPILIASVLGFGLTLLTFLFFLRSFLRKPDFLIPLVLLVIGLGVILRNILLPRSTIPRSPSFYIEQSLTQGNETWIRISQLTTLTFFALCFFSIIVGIYFQNKSIPQAGMVLTALGLFAYIPIILSSLVSDKGGLTGGLFLFPVYIIAVFLSPRLSRISFLSITKSILLLYVYSSLLALILFPDWASTPFNQTVIGVNIRLFGVTSHPNTLGYISVASLVVIRPGIKKSKLNYLHYLASLCTLILAQSKTAWATGLILIGIDLTVRMLPIRKYLISRILLIIIWLGVFVLIYFFLQENFLIDLFGYGFGTLTGRTSVWKITIDTWLKNPLFGYGPRLWDLDFRLQFGYLYLWAGQAHNQILHTLGSSGLLGIIGLIAYIYALIKLASRHYIKDHSVSFGLVIMLLMRILTETPMRNYLLDESFLIHGILFTLLIISEREGSNKLFKMNDFSQENDGRSFEFNSYPHYLP